MKSGFVALFGLTNAGKSTLINSLLNQHVVITSSKPQTTRSKIAIVYNDADSQIVFLDTPGIHKPEHLLGQMMLKDARQALIDVELTLLVVDGTMDLEPLKTDDFNIKTPLLIALNKIDLMTFEQGQKKIAELREIFGNEIEIIEISAKDKGNLDELLIKIKSHLEEGTLYYPKDVISDHPVGFLIQEFVREKAMRLTKEEVPHAITTKLESFKLVDDYYEIYVSIFVDKDSQKGIVIGKGGKMLKDIRVYASEDMKDLLGKKVELHLTVKLSKGWRDSEKLLQDFGN